MFFPLSLSLSFSDKKYAHPLLYNSIEKRKCVWVSSNEWRNEWMNIVLFLSFHKFIQTCKVSHTHKEIDGRRQVTLHIYLHKHDPIQTNHLPPWIPTNIESYKTFSTENIDPNYGTEFCTTDGIKSNYKSISSLLFENIFYRHEFEKNSLWEAYMANAKK